MDEARFVLKCFAFAMLLLVISQLKAKNGTVETQIQAALVNTEMSNFVNKAAEGGVKLINQAVAYVKIKSSQNKNPSKRDLEIKTAALQEAAVKKVQEINNEIETVVTQKKNQLKVYEELVEEIK